MFRLAFYLFRQFLREASALFFAALFLIWITQALRLFDVITAKGQDVFTLAGQAVLTTPALGKTIVEICVAIGIVRTMQAMQVTRELHAIHAARRTPGLWAALTGFILVATLFATALANWVEPVARFAYGQSSEKVAADLVGRALEPHRFNEIAPDFVVEIGGRNPDGTISNFFADDRRTPARWRTYSARSAKITLDTSGYFIQLRDGVLQFQTAKGEYTEVRFSSYELALDRISTEATSRSSIYESTTPDLLAAENWPLPSVVQDVLDQRFAETFRVISFGLLFAALMAFPHARRGRNWVPMEIVVVVLTLVERTLSESLQIPPLGRSTGSLVIFAVAALILAFRLHGYRLRPSRVTAA